MSLRWLLTSLSKAALNRPLAQLAVAGRAALQPCKPSSSMLIELRGVCSFKTVAALKSEPGEGGTMTTKGEGEREAESEGIGDEACWAEMSHADLQPHMMLSQGASSPHRVPHDRGRGAPTFEPLFSACERLPRIKMPCFCLSRGT
jgi:hypothetical protein